MGDRGRQLGQARRKAAPTVLRELHRFTHDVRHVLEGTPKGLSSNFSRQLFSIFPPVYKYASVRSCSVFGQTRADCLVLRLYNVLLFRGVWFWCQLALLSTPLRVTHIVTVSHQPFKKKIFSFGKIPICCVDGRLLLSTHSLNTGHVHDLPGFPFTVILPIYDILDLYSFVELTPNVHRKVVSI